MKTIRSIGSLAFVLGLFVVVFAGIPWHVLVADDPVVPWWLRTAVFCLLGGILVVLLAVAVEQRLIKRPPEPAPSAAPDAEIVLQNAAEMPGRRKDLSALVRLILGGELTEYTEMMGQARTAAANRMVAQAADLGADAIINVRYMTTSVVGSAAELLVYGTAVKLGE